MTPPATRFVVVPGGGAARWFPGRAIGSIRRKYMKGKLIVIVFLLATGMAGWSVSPAFGDV